MKHRSLRARLLWAVLAPLLLVALAITGFLVERYVRDLRTNHEKRSEALAAQVQSAAGFALFIGDREHLRDLAASLQANDPLINEVWIRDRESRVVAHVTKDAAGISTPGSALRTRSYPLQVSAGAAAGDAFLDGGVTIVADDHVLGQIDIQYDDTVIRHAVTELLILAGLVAAGAVAVGTLVAVTLARRISEPVFALSLAARRISAGDLRARVMVERGGVLDELVDNTNAMAQNLEMAQDILRWRIAEATAELRSQRDAAERATQAKSRFLAAASHDLRQPLQALGLFAFQLRQEITAPDARNLIQKIEASVIALQDMFGALLDLSRIDAHGIVATPVTTHLGASMRRICSQMKPVAGARDLELRCCVGEDAVYADPTLVERILLNLISNALKYTEHGRITVRCQRRGEMVRLSVWDSGIGIERSRHDEIFREFVQVGNEERNPENGLGIGLSICREMASAMGTRIGVRSTPGRGSLFYIDLPSADGAAAFEDEPVTGVTDTDENCAGHVHLLVADREFAMRVGDLLKSWHLSCAPLDPHEQLQEQDGDGAEHVVLADQTALSAPDAEQIAEALWQQAPGAVVVVIGEADFRVPANSSWARYDCVYLDRRAPAGRLRAALSAAIQADTSEA